MDACICNRWVSEACKYVYGQESMGRATWADVRKERFIWDGAMMRSAPSRVTRSGGPKSLGKPACDRVKWILYKYRWLLSGNSDSFEKIGDEMLPAG